MSSVTQKDTRTIIRRVLEETGYAYMLSCEAYPSNADYAEYASSQALGSFRTALMDPELSYEQLCHMLRRATRREATRRCKTPWSVFMAGYLTRHSNANEQGTIN